MEDKCSIFSLVIQVLFGESSHSTEWPALTLPNCINCAYTNEARSGVHISNSHYLHMIVFR